MENISTIKERIFQFIENKGITKAEFCDKTGISYANFKGKSLLSELGGDKVAEIVSIYAEISPDWLLTGTGSMLRSGTPQASSAPAPPAPTQTAAPTPQAPDDSSMHYIMQRYESLIAENALLKKEVEELKQSRGKSIGPTSYTIGEKPGTLLVAEQAETSTYKP